MMSQHCISENLFNPLSKHLTKNITETKMKPKQYSGFSVILNHNVCHTVRLTLTKNAAFN